MNLLHGGQQVRGDTYRVDRKLGEGAFSEVYRVRHRFLGRQAMKVFKAVGTLEETNEMLAEASILSTLGHPNIIRVFDADLVDTPQGTRGFFTMEYVAGGNLEDFWASHRNRFIPVADTVLILTQVAAGLAVAHADEPPIIHRDITPQNILVGYDAHGIRARLSDFGLAKRADPLTRMASTRGTLAYKAPEALRHARSDSVTADVWALGTIAYLLLTDRFPYTDPGGMASFLGAQFRQPPEPPSRYNPQVDPELDEIVLRTLAVDPADRLSDASKLLLRLRALRAAQPDPPAVDPQQQTSKEVLGRQSPLDEQRADLMVRRAFELARQVHTLSEAADLLEEAFNKDPALRERHAGRLRLWRNGVMM